MTGDRGQVTGPGPETSAAAGRLQVLTAAGQAKGEVELPDSVFRQEPKTGLVWESVRAYLDSQRQGTAKAKTRGEVSGTGKKPYRQKGTGRARHGSRRSPIFKGGGVVFGPQPRDYGHRLPKRQRRLALYTALSARHAEGAVKVVEDFDVPTAKTRELAGLLTGFGLSGSVLLLVGATSRNLKLASGNVPWLTVMPAPNANCYAVLRHDNVVFTVQGLGKFLAATGAE